MAVATATLGIDLASQPKNTALCAIVWEAGQARVTALRRGAVDGKTGLDDRSLLAAMRGEPGDVPAPSKVAIDAPLGWPVDFARAVCGLPAWPIPIAGDRRRLERRATDHWVHQTTGKQPLSVTTDRIAYAAMRAAGLLAAYATRSGDAVDRSGFVGLVCETYPDPAIRCLGIWPEDVPGRQSYKGDALDIRKRIVERLGRAAPWLRLSPEHVQRCIASDDCLDALVCALVARAAETRRTVPPPEDLVDEARAEGWIHLPLPEALAALL